MYIFYNIFFIFDRVCSFVNYPCISATCMLTFDLDSSLVTVICARQTNIVIEILGRADTLVAAIEAIVFTVADLGLIYALAIIANEHAVAIHASLLHFVVIELHVGYKRAGQTDVAVAEQTDVTLRSETKLYDYLRTIVRRSGGQLAHERSRW